MSEQNATSSDNKRTVLVVDDEPDLREIYSYRLELEGYQIFTAESGYEAIELLKSKPKTVDLVMSDLMMPNGNGIELATFCVSKKIPVLIASAYIDSFLSKIPKNTLTLKKPFKLEELSKALEKALELNQQNDEQSE